MDLRKIPILKDIDFSDSRTRLKLFALALGILVLILMYVIPRDGESPVQDSAGGAALAASSADMEIAEGEDNDERLLSSENMMDARESGRGAAGNSLAGIYEDGTEQQDDIMADLTAASHGGSSAEEVSGREPVLQSAPSTAGRPSGGGQDSFVRRRETSEERRARRKREMMEQAGVRYADSRAQDSAILASLEGRPGPRSGTHQDDESVLGVAQVRRSGDISTLSGSVMGAGHLSSLRKKERYVTTDREHLFKVMFPSSEKIVSGQRVPVRLLEDMVVDGILVPANTYLSSVVTFGDGRLSVSVSSVELNGTIHVLRYEGYDTDGMKGLYCPSSKSEKTAREAVDQAGRIGRSAVSSSVTGLATQVIAAGASVLEKSKGVTEITVTAGYSFYLRERQDGRNNDRS